MPPELTQWRLLTDAEQPRVLPLLARCFPAYWETVAAQNSRFPFRERSFAALTADGEPGGHVGVIEYDVSDGHGGRLKMGGIASVAVDECYRGLGVATRLCQLVIDWARERGDIASLPLYTGKYRVYAKSGWRNYQPFAPRRIRFAQTTPSPAPARLRGPELTAAQRQAIAAIYAANGDFPGKTVRHLDGDSFVDWPRIFAEPDYRFALGDNIAAILAEDALLECNWRPGVPAPQLLAFLHGLAIDGALDASLPENSPAWTALSAAGTTFDDCPRDLMHGESPMFLDLAQPGPHARPGAIFYPIVDKF